MSYVVAQMIVVGFWAYQILTNGIDRTPEYDDLSVSVILTMLAFVLLIPAFVFGLLDGVARLFGPSLIRILLALLLILFTGLLIVPMEAFFTSPVEMCFMFCGPPETDIPSMNEYLGTLVGVEFALLLELLLATTIPLLAK